LPFSRICPAILASTRNIVFCNSSLLGNIAHSVLRISSAMSSTPLLHTYRRVLYLATKALEQFRGSEVPSLSLQELLLFLLKVALTD
jgi:hypothetical protein